MLRGGASDPVLIRGDVGSGRFHSCDKVSQHEQRHVAIQKGHRYLEIRVGTQSWDRSKSDKHDKFKERRWIDEPLNRKQGRKSEKYI